MSAGLRNIKIKLSGEAQMSKAVSEVESSLGGVRRAADDASDGFDRAGEAFDGTESKALGFKDTLDGAAGAAAGFGQIMSGDVFGGLVTAGQGVADFAGGAANFLVPALKSGVTWLGKTRVGTMAVAAASKVAAVAARAWAVAQRILNAVMRANPIGIIITVIAGLIAIIVAAYKKNETFRRIVQAVWRAIQAAIKAVVNWLVNTAWPFIQRVWNGIVAGVTNVKNKVVAAFTWIRSKISGAVAGIKGFLSGMWDGLLSGARAAVNGAIGLINGAIGAINGLIRGANKVPGINIPQIPNIPYLATGGIVTGPTLAVIGERGPEAVVPLDRAGEFGMGGPQILEAHIHVGDEVVRVVRTELRSHDRDLRRRVGAIA